jgi:hypothetical protein
MDREITERTCQRRNIQWIFPKYLLLPFGTSLLAAENRCFDHHKSDDNDDSGGDADDGYAWPIPTP